MVIRTRECLLSQKRHMEKDREEWTSRVHGSSPCSCKCSTGPSGRPCPTSARAFWTTLSPTVELMPLCHHLNTKIKDELSCQSKFNDAFQLGCFLMCSSYTNENTSTCRARNVCTVAGLSSCLDHRDTFKWHPQLGCNTRGIESLYAGWVRRQ